MATIVLGIVGAIGGAAIAGPAGAAKGAMLGWSIGSTVGAVVDQSMQHYYTADMGRTNDLRVTTAAYGSSIPQCWGKTRVPGCMIWGTDLIEHEQDQHSGGGGSGGPTVTTRVYTYTVSLAIALCTGEPNTLNTVQKIYADNIVVYDVNQPSADNIITPRFYQGTETQLADPLIISTAGNTMLPAGTDNPAFRGLNYMVIQDMLLTSFGDSIPNFSVELSSGVTYASQVITDIVRQLGVNPSTQLDVTLVTAIPVTGLISASRIDGKSGIQPILDAYTVDLIDVDGKVKAVPRGMDPVATITFDDLGAQTIGSGMSPSTQRLIKTRADDLILPQRVDVAYYSPTIDFQQATQSAIRQSAKSNLYVSQSYPLTLTDNEAVQLANRVIYTAWVERVKYAGNLMPKWAALIASDVIMLQTDVEGTLVRARVIEAEAGLPGEIKCKFLPDDETLLIPVITSVTAPSGGVATSTPVPLDFFAWSGLEINKTDGISAGIYVVSAQPMVRNIFREWVNGSVLMSIDGGTTYYSIGSVTTKTVFGNCTSTLAAGPGTLDGYGFDITDTVGVNVNGTLTSSSEHEGLSGIGTYGLVTAIDQSVSNLGNYELFAYTDATLTSANNYTLSYLLRAQKGTVSTGHTGSDMFVSITNNIARINVSSNLIGQVVLIKVVPDRIDPTTVTPQSVLIASPASDGRILTSTGWVDIPSGGTPLVTRSTGSFVIQRSTGNQIFIS
jgi:hypothetical protein